MLLSNINRYSQADLKPTLTKIEVVFQPENLILSFKNSFFLTASNKKGAF